MPEPDNAPITTEPRSERLGMAVTPTEKSALTQIASWFPDKYDGVSSVLRDYTPAKAIEFVERLRSSLVSS